MHQHSFFFFLLFFSALHSNVVDSPCCGTGLRCLAEKKPELLEPLAKGVLACHIAIGVLCLVSLNASSRRVAERRRTGVFGDR